MKKLLLFAALFSCIMVAKAGSKAEYDFRIEWDHYSLNYKIKSDNTVELVCGDVDGDFIVPKAVINENITYSVTSIGETAFGFSLESATIHNGITSIDKTAFNYCESLVKIDVAADNPSYSSLDGILFNKDKTTLICYPECKQGAEFIIPNTVTKIEDRAFNSVDNLKILTIPSSVVTFGEDCFRNCYFSAVICKTKTPEVFSDDLFDGIFDLVPFYVPCGTKDAYKVLPCFKVRNNIIEKQVYDVSVTSNNEAYGKVEVAEGTECNEVILTATASKNYKFKSWSDGNTESPRTIFVTDDTNLVATFVTATAVDDVNFDSAVVYAQGKNIVVESVNAEIYIYNTMGRCIYSGTETTIAVPAAGIYIVKIGSETHKVMVK